MNIGTLPTRHARYRPAHLALVCGEARFTYAELNQRLNLCANALRGLGLKKGDKVATVLSNCVELLEVYWAAAKLGLVVVPLSPLMRAAGLATLLRDSDTAVVFGQTGGAEQLREARGEVPNIGPDRYFLVDLDADVAADADSPLAGMRSYHAWLGEADDAEPERVEISGDDPYNIVYSSGTTGLPKGIIHTHQIRAMYCMLFASAYRIRPESVILHAGSIVFNGAFLTLMPWMFLGTTYVLAPKFDPKLWVEAVRSERVTHAMLVPSQIVALLSEPSFTLESCASLEMIGSVGAPLHAEHKKALIERLPDRFYELYGLTEGFMTILDRDDVAAKSSSVGAVPPLLEMRIVDDNGDDLPTGQAGEIIGRGPMLMPGYYKRPDLTAAAIRDGWLYTGDVGYVDEDGYLFLVDRKKDLIISGGVNVYPRDIEEIVVRHPAVQEASVFGVADPKWGETPIAAVTLKSGERATSDDIRAFTNERVEAKFQRLSGVVIVDDLPRGVTGKVLKRTLREQYQTRS
ncbi:MAG: class I adenylate-forming enzyme family protein [Haliangiales bacterium]